MLEGLFVKKVCVANSTKCSQAITHPSTDWGQRCSDWTRTGVFSVIWPLATLIAKVEGLTLRIDPKNVSK